MNSEPKKRKRRKERWRKKKKPLDKTETENSVGKEEMKMWYHLPKK